ncbi:MAG: YfiR family protein [Candidatus Poribacteria bacterium]|nr:YfiR family protein [Candidatus Poribacteria bacterium]
MGILTLFQYCTRVVTNRKPAYLIGVVIGLIAFTSVQATDAESISAREYQIKAAYLYNFAKFVQWPAEAFKDDTTPITIGILGEDPFSEHLDRIIKNKTAQGRQIKVRRFKGLKDLEFCHILFISESEKKRLKQILESLENLHILTVSETKGFAQSGGMVKFLRKKDTIGFEINISTAECAGLKMNSQLLSLAKIVRDKHRR